MTPLREWLKPPRTLFLILFLLTLISVSALGWFGWKVLDQERMVEAQRLAQKLEQSADRIAATLRGTLAETGERLGNSLIPPPEDGLLLTIEENRLVAAPPGRLLYDLTPILEPEAKPELFAEGEAAEFIRARPEEALEAYLRLAVSPDATVRAGAFLREARVLRKIGRAAASRPIYEQLAALPNVTVAGAPAEIVARLALADLSGERDAAARLRHDLLTGRWRLSRGQFKFYWSEVARLSGDSQPPPAEAWALSEAASIAWQERRRDPDTRREETVWVHNKPLLLVWRGRPERRLVLIIEPASLLRPAMAGSGVFCAAADSAGRVVSGRRAAGHVAIRTAAETQLPWTLYITADEALGQTGVAAQQRFLLLGISVMVLFLILATYILALAIRREIEVSRMQSDFVAAVSHEFRSPLTTLRQLSELLLLGRVPGEERRRLYYEMLVRETARLQRLIEGLLHFGRMEAGARPYRFEELDAAALVRRVAAEFEQQMEATGRHIEIQGSPASCPIEADPEALSVALRNLVDNAIKYSPGYPIVWLEWGVEKECVAIRVRDKGLGISPAERKAIFRRFVRGTAAAHGNVKGSGLGLAMVRHIVTAHGGEIVVASQPGEGSTFTMRLPSMERA
jgi:signal transduction histidine kinase